MVTSTSNPRKPTDKIPVSKSKTAVDLDLQIPVSPTNSESLEDELSALRAKNKVLMEALKGVNESAVSAVKKNFDLVWFARNRCRFPNHDASKRIQNSKEHRKDLELLKSNDCDYHHGFHAGVLAASRMFMQQSDVRDVEDHLAVNKKVKESKKEFERRKSLPQVDIGEFPIHA